MIIDRQNNLDLEPSKAAFCSFGQGWRWGITGLKKTFSLDGLKYVGILFLAVCVMMVFNVPVVTQIIMEFVFATCIAMMISENIHGENRFSIGRAISFVFNKAFGKIILLYLLKFSVGIVVFITLIVMVVIFFSHDLATLFTPFVENFTQNAFETEESLNRYLEDVIIQYQQTDVLSRVSMNFIISVFLIVPLVLVTLSLCVFCASFYAVPLIISSDIGIFKALWVSFIAVNKNILSFLSLSLVALFYLVFCFAVFVLLAIFAQVLSMIIGPASYLLIGFVGFFVFIYLVFSLMVFETYVRVDSCFDVFWYEKKDVNTKSKIIRPIP